MEVFAIFEPVQAPAELPYDGLRMLPAGGGEAEDVQAQVPDAQGEAESGQRPDHAHILSNTLSRFAALSRLPNTAIAAGFLRSSSKR